MRDKEKSVQDNEIVVTVENRSAGLGSYELVLVSFGLIFVLKALTSALRSVGKQQDKRAYMNAILDFMADSAGHAISLALSLFSFTIAFMHFRRIPLERVTNGHVTKI